MKFQRYRLLSFIKTVIPSESNNLIQETFNTLESDKTIIMISHQLSVAATCDRVLVMDNGKIVQQGVHKKLIKQKGIYKKLWERELAVKEIENKI